MKRVRSEPDAEDLLQEIFLKISMHIEKLVVHDKLHAWIYQITSNAIVDYYRRTRENTELPESLTYEDEALSDDPGNANQEIAGCLQGMIEQLPDKYKEAILLTEYQNLTQKELAERLGMSVSGAKSRIHRARKLLKEMILDCCKLEFDRYGNIIDFSKHQNGCEKC
jgi:RNA polymerase sigma-70 factor (ECF subfamily)